MKPQQVKGYLLAALAAAAYGTNPAFAVPLYAQGMNPTSVLLFRYLLGLPLLAALMALRGVPVWLPRAKWGPVATLGVLMGLSSLALFESYKYMNSGIASTLLFVYPVMVAVIMIFVFHERFTASLGLCLMLMAAGLLLLMRKAGGAALDPFGCLLVMGSALTYALYIVMVNVSATVRTIPTTCLLFHVLLWGCVVFAVVIATGTPLTLPSRPGGWLSLGCLALVPTVISLACTTRAIQLVGSTPTAVLGALEPVSAVILSVVVLDQAITPRDILGSVLIVVATTVVVGGSSVDRALMHVRKMFPRRPSSPSR